jgi:16S rRNA (guanine527-N7)-methyltransferase
VIEALAAAADHAVSRETFERVELIAARVTEEASRQNLVSVTTIADLWQRHIVDSVQLLRYAGATPWLDLGTGAGFPGLVIAAFDLGPVILCEERRLRHIFLSTLVDELALPWVTVAGCRVQALDTFAAGTISARAFAPLNKLLESAVRFSTETTTFVLPKGQNARQELALAQNTWHGEFRLEPSVTHPDSAIIVAHNIRPKAAA